MGNSKIEFEKTILYHIASYCWNDVDGKCENCYGVSKCNQMADNLMDFFITYESYGLIEMRVDGVHTDIYQSDLFKGLKYCYVFDGLRCSMCPIVKKCHFIRVSIDGFLIWLKKIGLCEEFKVDFGKVKKEVKEVLEYALNRVDKILKGLE